MVEGRVVGPRFALIVHRTDAQREWAYDRDSHIGKLGIAFDEAAKRRGLRFKRSWRDPSALVAWGGVMKTSATL